MEIRAFGSEDKEDVWRLLRQFAVSYPPDRAAFDRGFDTIYANSQAVCLAGVQDQAVVGYLIAFVLPTLFANGPILEIVELVVDESSRSLGHGSMLVNQAIHVARQASCVEVVVPTRRAGAFYGRLGFQESASYYKVKL